MIDMTFIVVGVGNEGGCEGNLKVEDDEGGECQQVLALRLESRVGKTLVRQHQRWQRQTNNSPCTLTSIVCRTSKSYDQYGEYLTCQENNTDEPPDRLPHEQPIVTYF